MHIQKQIDQLITDQASQWLETLRTAGPEQQKEFHQWLSQSRRQMEEFLEVVAIERALGDLDAERLIDVDALVAQITPKVTALRSNPAGGALPRSRWRAGLAAAAAVAAVAIAVPVYFN